MKRSKLMIPLIIMIVVLVFAACQNESAPPEQPGSEDPETPDNGPGDDVDMPDHLRIYTDLGMSDEWFQQFVIDPAKQQFPHLEMSVQRRQEGATPNELVVSGEFPDILYNSTPRLTTYKHLDLLQDMTPLIEQYNVDLAQFHGDALDAIRQWGTNGELYGLPLWLNFTVLYYNEELFDRFAVPYPEDGLTWEEAIQLSERLTRNEDGVVYRGLDIHDLHSFYSQLSLPFIDGSANQAALENPGAQRVYQLMRSLYSIPGNEPDNRGNARAAFLTDQTLAMWPMYADVPAWINDLVATGDAFEWNMAQMPEFTENPGYAWQVDSHNLHVTATTDHPEAAFQVVMHLLSQEPQLNLVRHGLLSSRIDDSMMDAFGAELPIFEGKHLDAIFLSVPAPKFEMTEFDNIGTSEFTNGFRELEEENLDINTALRLANERANQRIQEELARRGTE